MARFPVRETIACLGAGRMGRGIAVVFAFAGHSVAVIDFKPRSPEAFARLAAEVEAEVSGTVAMLARIGLMRSADVGRIAARVRVVAEADTGAALADAAVVFEGVPEVLGLKREALARASRLAGPRTIIASTTSTILVDALADAVVDPARFLNAHWLNPAFLVPLVEVSPGAATAADTTTRLVGLLEAIGKVPVICAASPGFVVPRIQALAMNEAARMVEEGVASAADIDKAVKYGFGFRFAVLGLLEFIDWGGGDILHYASAYLAKALNHPRYEAPDIIGRNMAAGHIGMTTGRGFLDYEGVDLAAYREGRLSAFADLLRGMGLARPPVIEDEA
ncbi:MAG TPA: 3-hydroxybutyryl-CoA dehydrogenase [Rhodopila sp.]